MAKKLLSLIIKIAVSGVILFFLIRNVGAADLWASLRAISPWTVLAAACIYVSSQALSAFRLSIILRRDHEVPYPKVLSIYFIGMFFNNFLPTAVGGDVVKGYFLYKETRRADLSIASIFMDRYAGFCALMTITALSVALGSEYLAGTPLPYFFAVLIGGFIAVSLAIWVESLHGWAMRLLQRVHLYGINKKIDSLYAIVMGYKKRTATLWRIFAFSLVIQTSVILGYYVLGTGLGVEIGLSRYFLFIPLVVAVTMLPISLAGLGIREGAFVYLFALAGAPKAQAITLSLLWFSMAALISVAGGIEYLRWGGGRTARELAKAEADELGRPGE